jgi:hypothetical protein
MPDRKSPSKPKTRPRHAAPRRPVQELITPELMQPVLAGRLRTKLSQHIGDARSLSRACMQAVAELVDGSLDEPVILRGVMWLHERCEGDAVTAAEARAAEADAKYRALVGNVKDLFEASRQPAGHLHSAHVEAETDVADVAADAEASELPMDTDDNVDADEAIELEAELLGEPPAAPVPAPAPGKWVHDSKTGLNHFVPNSDR